MDEDEEKCPRKIDVKIPNASQSSWSGTTVSRQPQEDEEGSDEDLDKDGTSLAKIIGRIRAYEE